MRPLPQGLLLLLRRTFVPDRACKCAKLTQIICQITAVVVSSGTPPMIKAPCNASCIATASRRADNVSDQSDLFGKLMDRICGHHIQFATNRKKWLGELKLTGDRPFPAGYGKKNSRNDSFPHLRPHLVCGAHNWASYLNIIGGTMKKILTAIILGIAMAGVTFAQAKGTVKGSETDIALVEFTPNANASDVPADIKRQLQTMIAAALANSKAYDVYDIRHTRNATQSNLDAINNESSTTAAARVGKQLNVKYVVTGIVTGYDIDNGSISAKVRMIEVSTGKVTYKGEFSHQAQLKLVGNARLGEMKSKVVKHLVDKIAAGLLP